MNEQLKKIVEEAGFNPMDIVRMGAWYQTDKLYNLIIQECITAVENTPKHCAYTTYDLTVVDCTIKKSVESIKQHFNLPNESK